MFPRVASTFWEFFSPGMDTEIWFPPWLSTLAPVVPALTRSLRMVTMVASWALVTDRWVL